MGPAYVSNRGRYEENVASSGFSQRPSVKKAESNRGMHKQKHIHASMCAHMCTCTYTCIYTQANTHTHKTHKLMNFCGFIISECLCLIHLTILYTYVLEPHKNSLGNERWQLEKAEAPLIVVYTPGLQMCNLPISFLIFILLRHWNETDVDMGLVLDMWPTNVRPLPKIQESAQKQHNSPIDVNSTRRWWLPVCRNRCSAALFRE